MAERGPVDRKAAVFALCAAVFVLGFGYVLVDRSVEFHATPSTGGSGPTAPMTNPQDAPQGK